MDWITYKSLIRVIQINTYGSQQEIHIAIEKFNKTKEDSNFPVAPVN